MKERPILFSAAMVRALLEGRKTQTRRILDPKQGPNFGFTEPEVKDGFLAWVDGRNKMPVGSCRYGRPGDRLWVRETFGIWRRTSHEYEEYEQGRDATYGQRLTDWVAERAQGFPDEYHFTGNREAVVKQIGNAVPPNTAKALAMAVLQ